MSEADLEIEACGVSVTRFGVALHVRAPDGELHLIAMPRELAARLAAEIIFGLDAMPAARIGGNTT